MNQIFKYIKNDKTFQRSHLQNMQQKKTNYQLINTKGFGSVWTQKETRKYWKKFLEKKDLNKKILIIGGTGFLGYHTASKAIKKKWIVHSISSKLPVKKRFCKGVKYFICDISKKTEIKKIVKINYDFIINFGGYVNHSDKKKL